MDNVSGSFQMNQFLRIAFLQVLLLVVILVNVPSSKGECCGKDGLFSCKGKGHCNIECCSCEGGCKDRKRSVDFDVDVDLAQTRFENLDTNGDGVVSLTEFHHQHVLKNKRSADFVNKEWTLMDENQNGVIEPVEFDESLQGQK